MIRPIVMYGSPILRQKALPVAPDDPRLPSLIQDLWDTMYNAQGIGLAAPQIGVLLRVFVVDVSGSKNPEEPPLREVFINPRLVALEAQRTPYEEGCLSIPGLRERIYRPSGIEIEYYDANFRLKRARFMGMAARAIQHEYDHLEGRLFIDYLSPLRRQLLRAKLREIAAGRIEAAYPTTL
ncbi:MAG: peptide deformylase [Bacteroidia bacterium]